MVQVSAVRALGLLVCLMLSVALAGAQNVTQAASPYANTTQAASPYANTTQAGLPNTNTTQVASPDANTTQAASPDANTTQAASPDANTTQAASPDANTSKPETDNSYNSYNKSKLPENKTNTLEQLFSNMKEKFTPVRNYTLRNFSVLYENKVSKLPESVRDRLSSDEVLLRRVINQVVKRDIASSLPLNISVNSTTLESRLGAITSSNAIEWGDDLERMSPVFRMRLSYYLDFGFFREIVLNNLRVYAKSPKASAGGLLSLTEDIDFIKMRKILSAL